LVTEYVPEQVPGPVDVWLGDGDGLCDGDGEVVVGLGLGLLPLMLTEKELVSSPAPPCQSSNPASTSIRYQLVLVYRG
jgi:hypothetical protein